MKFSVLSTLFLATVATALPSSEVERSTSFNATVLACKALKLVYSTQVFFPGEANYTAENEHFWTPTDYLSPTCVFTPKCTTDVSSAILILTGLKATFAVRGGGHMPIPGYANTIGGVLIGLTDLNEIQLSSDNSYVSVGPGRRWEEVYAYLEPYGLVALGGRVGIVGVPGLLLGGGISFYSNQHGFASDNVVAYEVVLASGKIVTATSTQYSDLFWALKGGGNSFGIVTRFDLLTYTSPTVCAGITEIPSTEKDLFLSAVANFGQYGSADPKAAVIPSIFMLASLNITVYTSALFYDGTNCTQPALANVTAIPAIENTYGSTTLATYVEGTDALIADGTRQAFRVVSSLATAEALSIVHDTFVDMVTANIWDVAGLQASVAFQPVTKNFIQQGINKGGNPQGVDISKAPYFWMVENFSWTDPADDATIYAFAAQVTDIIEAKLSAAGQAAQYHYMNDAGLGQEIFQNYGAGNLAKLRSIRAKYDPLKVYTNLMPGGWKVDAA
ncbi:FAD binding domain-containing protein [Hyaloscypha bicolor E]|uniref:FAD binding domain-containing protein n=1 Tax=Hyaloscypha bicolor E TaxID=1095630 RepID=A0A2J6T0Z0_9HELO|nr:FAD binding domain-containing protein [Hyaloscypha bicolor E]PMD56688.1 FAD binding domain-containing protein [Hyaloscypha bicolor E]